MADGILCKHCGRQETDHEYVVRLNNAHKRIQGYKLTLLNCRGFVGEIEPEIQNKEHLIEYYERQAQGRAAWGHFQAVGRLQNFRRKIEEFDRQGKKGAEAKKKYIEECRSSHGFYVG